VSERPTILVLLGCFRPGLQASGPNITWVRVATSLSDRYHFRFVTQADPGEPTGRWHVLAGCERIALRRGKFFVEGVVHLLRETPHDLLVSNGFFDPALTLPALLLKRMGLLQSSLLIAPRGEFAPPALKLKSARKRSYLRMVGMLGLLDRVFLQATDEQEAANIRAALFGARIVIGPNLRPLDLLPPFVAGPAGGPLRIAFLARIDNMKNLDWAVRMLGAADVPVVLDIYGPVTNQAYWEECQSAIAHLPNNVICQYHGAIAPDTVPETLARHDLMLLPTRGENFGHAIVDAFLAGTPALIADTTPWRGLTVAKAGADLPLDDVAPWIAFLRRFAAMNDQERLVWRAGARRFAEEQLAPETDRERLASCFEAAMAGNDGT
jgi:glycosyltransferase involved in cell wall biosynthesis